MSQTQDHLLPMQIKSKNPMSQEKIRPYHLRYPRKRGREGADRHFGVWSVGDSLTHENGIRHCVHLEDKQKKCLPCPSHIIHTCCRSGPILVSICFLRNNANTGTYYLDISPGRKTYATNLRIEPSATFTMWFAFLGTP